MSRIPGSLAESTPPATIAEPEIADAVAVPYRAQLMDGWCWAATIEMIVLALAQQDVAQCRLANLEFQRDDCCPTNPECDEGVDLPEFAGILMTWGIDSARIDRPLGFDEVQQEVNAGRPIIYNLTFADGTDHTGIISAAQVISGTQAVFFLDSDAEAFRIMGRYPYGWVPLAFIMNAYGLPGNWTETILGIRLG